MQIAYASMLASLKQLLESRLVFRKTDLINGLQKVKRDAIKTGSSGNSRLVFVFAQVYESEILKRAELISEELRKARSSWSARQIVDAEHDLRMTISQLFKNDISQAAALAEEIGQLRRGHPLPQGSTMLQAFLTETDRSSKAGMSMVDATVDEVVAAARNDLAAKTPADRPSYVFQSFHGPVASIAQGNASVGSVSQEIGSATPQQIAEAVALIIKTLPTDSGGTVDTEQAKHDLAAAEPELRKGRVPFGLLQRGLGLLAKIKDVATRAPEAAEHIHRLGSMLGLN